MPYKPYVLYTPGFDVTSGGIRVMWGLYGWLLAKGQIVFVNAELPHVETVAIYPEIVSGNPLNGQKVVRYILNKPGVMGRGIPGTDTFLPGPSSFSPSDILYYFSRLFGHTDEDHYLFLPILNMHLFKDYGKKRTKIAYFVGKGMNTGIHPVGATLIDRIFAQDQQALADLLNDCKVLYCYDPVTAMTEISRLCGCRVVMVNPIYTEKEFSLYEPGLNGISWEKDKEVKLNTEYFRVRYEFLKDDFERKLDLFIEETQNADY
jgi:hypothetical protein